MDIFIMTPSPLRNVTSKISMLIKHTLFLSIGDWYLRLIFVEHKNKVKYLIEIHIFYAHADCVDLLLKLWLETTIWNDHYLKNCKTDTHKWLFVPILVISVTVSSEWFFELCGVWFSQWD